MASLNITSLSSSYVSSYGYSKYRSMYWPDGSLRNIFGSLRTSSEIIGALRKILALSGEKCHSYKLKKGGRYIVPAMEKGFDGGKCRISLFFCRISRFSFTRGWQVCVRPRRLSISRSERFPTVQFEEKGELWAKDKLHCRCKLGSVSVLGYLSFNPQSSLCIFTFTPCYPITLLGSLLSREI